MPQKLLLRFLRRLFFKIADRDRPSQAGNAACECFKRPFAQTAAALPAVKRVRRDFADVGELTLGQFEVFAEMPQELAIG